MTVELSRTSDRLPAARRFADELRRSMAEHKVGQRRLGKLTGCASSAVAQWRMARNLPRLDTAIRLAECLSNDRLAEIVRVARTQACQRCGTPFLNEGGAPKKYCSERCLTIAAKIRGVLGDRTPARKKLTAMRADLKATQDSLLELQVSVQEMCRSCEPAGYCRTTECPLRPVSPLPLAFGLKDVPLATKAPGAWSPEYREKQLARIREGNSLRWAKPGEREAQSQKMLARHANHTPEEHEAWVAKIRESKATPREARAHDSVSNRARLAGMSRLIISPQLTLPIRETDLAWAAGTFESEGTVAIARRGLDDTYRLLCSVVNTDLEMVEFFQDRWPSWIGATRGSNRGNRRPFWQWTTAGPRAAAFLEDVGPLVRTQRVDTKIRLGLEFYDHQRQWPQLFRLSGSGYKDAQRDFYAKMKALNQRGLVAVDA